MKLAEVPSTWRVVSPHHRKAHLRGDAVEVAMLLLRLGSIGLLSADGWVHLHLWQDGYRHIATIGPLFLVGAVSALVVATGLLVRPSRLIGTLGIGLVLGILAGLVASVNVGLFGFKESLSAPFAGESIALEIAAALTLAGWVALDFMKEPRRSEHAVRSGPERQSYSLIG
jgi:hypothetical protein